MAPPTQPSSLQADGSFGSVDLQWQDNATTEDGFRIYRAEVSGSFPSDFQQIDTVGTNRTSYDDFGLEDGERYFYRVTSFNADGESAPSNEADATTVLPAPNLTDVSVTDAREITVQWSLPDDSPDGVVEVLRAVDGGAYTTVATITDLSTTEVVDAGLLDGEQYDYEIRRTTDHATATSATVTSGTTPLPRPIELEITSIDGDQLTIQWEPQDNNADGYRVSVSDDAGATWTLDGTAGADATQYQTTDLLDGERYQVRVEAYTEHATAADENIAAGDTVVVEAGTTETFDPLELSGTLAVRGSAEVR